jgi:hypothetical protein
VKRFIALVLRYDPLTGERPIPLFEVAPGRFSRKPEFRPGQPHRTDPALYCMPLWQDHERGIEMRLVLDDRDVEQYRKVAGVEVVEGKEAINAKVRELFRPRYSVVDPALFSESIKAKRIRVDDIDKALPHQKQLEILYKRGALGMRKEEPYQLK